MTEQEVSDILKAINELKVEVKKNRQLLVGNGDRNAVLPRLDKLELFIAGVPTWRRFGELLQPVVNALIIAGLVYLIFGSA